ncbi:unnamed protein product [Microthlaspi erraticum]|uniref:TIR domain-containing protein n=1 Tax=Microthlaspi erraticum TaxID=1685480 RepID=A0A6D2KH58_9BRAS|nr:unnamed protein product [Microthlaspi erraticum]
MASSSSTPRTWTYRVFTSFHGPDVRKSFLTHFRKQFNYNGISMFNDQEIERGQTIAPALKQAIGGSRISIVVLTKNYASSSWCLDELVEIFKCKKDIGQIVMTVFYGVDPLHVQKQTGDFGKVFKKTCARKTKEERRKWSQALEDVGKIHGEHSINWDNEPEMIEKIARDVSNKLNVTISWDFEDMVGIEAHLENMQSVLRFCEDGAMIVGISGPAGIGKTTIARALQSRISSNFQLTCFMENLRGSCKNGLDEYDLKLRLQEKLLSNILNLNGMKIDHLRAIQERLRDQKVLIILDDVDDLQQLEALANETKWFGRGSRIIVTTEDKELLEQHGVNNIYQVGFPGEEEARQILCRHAFNQSSAPEGFDNLVERVRKLCSNLPMGLCVMGENLRNKKRDGWEYILHKLETSLDTKMKGVLSVGYDSLHKDDQFLFLLIAFFFNYQDEKHVMSMLRERNLDVKFGLKTLAYKSLIQITTKGKIVMHKLLQQVGREAVKRQDHGIHKILINADQICDVLENNSGSTSVRDIYFDLSTISKDVYISAGAFRKMGNLQSLSIYDTRRATDANVRVHVPEDMDFPPRLRLLRWEAYPGECLPRTFMPEYLVRLVLRHSKLENLWEGTQPLRNLKKMDLRWSLNLKKLPDLSNATSLQKLELTGCKSLVEIPCSVRNLHNLEKMGMDLCINLEVVPSLFNVVSLQIVSMLSCRKLRKIPDFFKNIKSLIIADTMLEELPESISHWSRLQSLSIYGSVNPYPLTTDEQCLEGSGADIEKLPDWIKDLHVLTWLRVGGCPKLASLPELPRSLITLQVDTCESLETLKSFPFDSRIKFLKILNCFKLGDEEAHGVITNHSLEAWLPGRTMPEEFNHRVEGNFLVIPSYFCKFRVCLVVCPKPNSARNLGFADLFCFIHINGCPADGKLVKELRVPYIREEHVFIFPYEVLDEDKEGWFELGQDNEMAFGFVTSSQDMEVTECGVQILTFHSGGRYESYDFSWREKVSEHHDESLSDGSNEFNEPRAKFFGGFTIFLSLVVLFLSLIIMMICPSV